MRLSHAAAAPRVLGGRFPGRLLICGVAVALLSACSWDYRQSLGLVAKGPDESAVVLKRPLEMPSTLPSSVDELPTPRPGARSRVEPNPEREAELLVTGRATTGASAEKSASETALLDAAGADAADPSVRATLAEEAEAREDGVRLLDGLLGRKPKGHEAELDAEAEAKRLAELKKSQGVAVPEKAE